MDNSDNTTDNTLTDNPGPGRPKGQPKTGGRPKGAKNKRTLEVEAVMRPLIPGAKKRIRALLDSKDEAVALKAATLIVSYIFGKPVDRREVSGPDGAAQKLEYTSTELARRVLSVMDLAVNETTEESREAAEATGGAGCAARACVGVGVDIPSEKNPPEKKSKAPEIKNPEYSPGDEVETNGLVFRCEGPKSWTCLENGKVIRRFPEHRIEWLQEWAGGRHGAG